MVFGSNMIELKISVEVNEIENIERFRQHT